VIFEFKEYDGINQTPAIALMARGVAELQDRGLAPAEIVGNWDQQAVVAFAGEVPVGVITFELQKWRKVVWIHFGFVAPEARRQGLYRQMWERVVKAAQKLGAAEIQGGTHVDNKAMLECAESLGRTRLFITTRFVVPAAKASRAQVKKK
jgi:GNAT superfamily N-acetyltransferase